MALFYGNDDYEDDPPPPAFQINSFQQSIHIPTNSLMSVEAENFGALKNINNDNNNKQKSPRSPISPVIINANQHNNHQMMNNHRMMHPMPPVNNKNMNNPNRNSMKM